MNFTAQIPEDEAAFIAAASKAFDIEPGEVIRLAMGVFRNELNSNGRDHIATLAKTYPAPSASERDKWFIDEG